MLSFDHFLRANMTIDFQSKGARPAPMILMSLNPTSSSMLRNVAGLKNFMCPPGEFTMKCLSHPLVRDSVRFLR